MATMSAELQQQMNELEISMDRAKKFVHKMDVFKRLTTNKDFKEIIEKDYFELEPSRLTMLLADPSLQDDEMQQDIKNQLLAIAYLRRYFVGINQQGRAAINQLEADEQTQEEILREELELAGGE